MDNRRNLARGLGSVDDVCIFFAEEFGATPGGGPGGMPDLCDFIRSCWKLEENRHAILALACSILNSGFPADGTLYWVDDKGKICREYILEKGVREVIASTFV